MSRWQYVRRLPRAVVLAWPGTDEELSRRATWPMWRRAVRPVGFIAAVVAAVSGLLTGANSEHKSFAAAVGSYGGLFTICVVVMVGCVLTSAVYSIRHQGEKPI